MDNNINNNTNNNTNMPLNSQTYQQSENVVTTNNSIEQMNNNINNNMYYSNNYYETKKKSKLFLFIIVLIVLIILSVVGYFIFNRNNSNTTNNSNNTNFNIKDELIGVWKATEQTTPSKDGVYLIPNITFVLNNDNTFTMDGEYKLRYTNRDGGSTIIEHVYGKYELDEKRSKIKLIYDKEGTFNFYKDYTKFEIKNGTMIINNYMKYNKISSNNTSNNDIISSSNNEIVGKWYWFLNNVKDESIYYIFKEDGTGSYTVDNLPINFNYEIKGNSLFIKASGVKNAKEKHYNISNNILSIDDGVGINVFIKE